MGLQNAIMRMLPERLVAPAGMSKRTMLDIVTSVGDTDFTADLPRIAAPTLVMCGSKDRPNLPAARQLANAIPHADLQIVHGV